MSQERTVTYVSGPDTYSVARPEGLEPPAYWFEASRSIRLSYGRVAPIVTSDHSSQPFAQESLRVILSLELLEKDLSTNKGIVLRQNQCYPSF
jgi:hypothetical protein